MVPTEFLRPTGRGLYYIDNSDAEFGLNLGIGVGYPWGQSRILELAYNYHWAITASTFDRFNKVQIGIVQEF